MIYDLNYLNNDYFKVFINTCNHYISEFSKIYNIDISKYDIRFKLRIGPERAACGHDELNPKVKYLFINPLECYSASRGSDPYLSDYKSESDFIKDLALHEVCHLFNSIVNDRKIIANQGHDDWFKSVYEPLRKQYTSTPFKVDLIDGVEYVNFESTSESISGDWIYELLNNKIEEDSQELTLIQESIDNLTEAVNLDWELDYSIDKINSSDLNKLTDYLIKKKYLLIANDELTSNFIYYNQVSLVSKIDSQVFIYSLKGSELSSDFEKVLSSIKGLSKSVNFDSKKLLKSFSLSNASPRILKVRFDPIVVKIPNLNRFLDVFKMLPIVDEVKLLEDTVELKLNTERSLAGVSEMINGALAKVACNVTYQISE